MYVPARIYIKCMSPPGYEINVNTCISMPGYNQYACPCQDMIIMQTVCLCQDIFRPYILCPSPDMEKYELSCWANNLAC